MPINMNNWNQTIQNALSQKHIFAKNIIQIVNQVLIDKGGNQKLKSGNWMKALQYNLTPHSQMKWVDIVMDDITQQINGELRQWSGLLNHHQFMQWLKFVNAFQQQSTDQPLYQHLSSLISLNGVFTKPLAFTAYQKYQQHQSLKLIDDKYEGLIFKDLASYENTLLTILQN